MNNLVPEKRMDSNGHMVTRWIKPTTAANAVGIPAPAAVVVSSAANDVLRTLKDAFRHQPITIPSDINMVLVEQRLDALPNDTMSFIKNYLDENDDNFVFQAMLISALNDREPATAVDDIAFMYVMIDPYRDSFEIDTQTEWWEGKFAAHDILHGSIRGISKMQIDGIDYQYGASRLRDLDEESVDKALAIQYALGRFEDDSATKMDSPIEYDSDLTPFFTDRALSQYLADNHERVDDVVDIMLERGISDFKVIDEMLDSYNPAIRSGAL